MSQSQNHEQNFGFTMMSMSCSALLRVHGGDGAEVYIDLLQKNRPVRHGTHGVCT